MTASSPIYPSTWGQVVSSISRLQVGDRQRSPSGVGLDPFAELQLLGGNEVFQVTGPTVS